MFGTPLTYVLMNLLEFQKQKDFAYTMYYSLIFSSIAFVFTYKLIPNFMEINHGRKIFGVDINKCKDYKDPADPDRKEVYIKIIDF